MAAFFSFGLRIGRDESKDGEVESLLPHFQEPQEEGIGEDKLLFAEGKLDVDELGMLVQLHYCAPPELLVKYDAVYAQYFQFLQQRIFGIS